MTVGERRWTQPVRRVLERLLRRSVSILMRQACGDEALKERMGSVRLRLKFGVELTGKEPGMTLELDQFDERPVRRGARYNEAFLLHDFAIRHVEFVTVPVPFEDFGASIDLVGKGVFAEDGRTGSQPHGSSFPCDVFLVLEDADDRMGRLRIEFDAVGILQSANMARKFDRGSLHPETETKVRRARLASVAGRVDLALYTPISKSSWHEDAGHAAQVFIRTFFAQVFSIDEHQVRRTIMGSPGVGQRFVDALVSVLKLNVLADHGDADAFLGIDDAFDEFSPIAHVRFAGLEVQDSADVFIEPFGLEVQGGFVDGILDVTRFDDSFDRNVAIKRQFLPNLRVERHLGAAKDHLRL